MRTEYGEAKLCLGKPFAEFEARAASTWAERRKGLPVLPKTLQLLLLGERKRLQVNAPFCSAQTVDQPRLAPPF